MTFYQIGWKKDWKAKLDSAYCFMLKYSKNSVHDIISYTLFLEYHDVNGKSMVEIVLHHCTLVQ